MERERGGERESEREREREFCYDNFSRFVLSSSL